MPSYIQKNRQINGHNFNWTISSSHFDFDHRWISIPEANIGHFHFHLNSERQRVQVWILEKWGWEEYLITERSRGLTNQLMIDDLLQSSYWGELAAIVQARA
jgi:hypothetical protein